MREARVRLAGVLLEVSQAWRQVRRAPAHHAVVVGTLALGIAATTTIFTVTDAVVFRPLPYADAHELYLIHTRFGSIELSGNSLLNLRDLEASLTTMSWLAGAEDRSPSPLRPAPARALPRELCLRHNRARSRNRRNSCRDHRRRRHARFTRTRCPRRRIDP